MASLECAKCKSVFRDVVRVRKCPLCGNAEFANVQPFMGVMQFPKWFTYGGNIGYFYFKTLRTDEAAGL